MFRAAKNLRSPIIELYFSKWPLKGILLRFPLPELSQH